MMIIVANLALFLSRTRVYLLNTGTVLIFDVLKEIQPPFHDRGGAKEHYI
jgi:hypothetical protein